MNICACQSNADVYWNLIGDFLCLILLLFFTVVTGVSSALPGGAGQSPALQRRTCAVRRVAAGARRQARRLRRTVERQTQYQEQTRQATGAAKCRASRQNVAVAFQAKMRFNKFFVLFSNTCIY